MSAARDQPVDAAPQGRPENLAELLGQEQLDNLGRTLCEQFLSDQRSCAPMLEQLEKIYEHYFCYLREVDSPWPRAAAVRTPFLNEACSQYTARAMEASLDPKGPVASVTTSGSSQNRRGERISKTLNYQFLHESELWENMDHLQSQLPIGGSSFMAMDWDRQLGGLSIETVAAEDFVVSYRYRGRLDLAQRMTQIGRYTATELEHMVERGVLLPVAAELEPAQATPEGASTGAHKQAQEMQGRSTPMMGDGLLYVIRMHTWIRIDTVLEPVIVWIDLTSKKVLRISTRYDNQGKPLCHFVPFTFLRNPTSGTYGVGIGQLSLSLIEGCDTLLRQIINLGTMASARPLFADKRALLPEGMHYVTPGEIVTVDYAGENMANAFFSPPFEGPPPVLFQCLGLLEQYLQRLSTVTDLMKGVAPRGSNTTATEAIALLEQGIKVFSVIHKRNLHALQKVINLGCRLNEMYLSDQKFFDILGVDTDEYRQWDAQRQAQKQAEVIVQAARGGQPVPPQMVSEAQMMLRFPVPPMPYSVKQDFGGVPGPSVQPAADPELASRAERMALAKAVMDTVVSSPVSNQDPQAVYTATKNFLRAGGADDSLLDECYPPPQAPPPPPDLPAYEENARFLEGQPNTALPDQDHVQHIGEHGAFLQSDMGLQLPPEGKDAVMRHIRAHQAMIIRQEHEAQPATGGMDALPLPALGPGVPTPDAGGVSELGGGPGGDGLPPPPGASSPLDLAPPSLRGRFPGLEKIAGPAR